MSCACFALYSTCAKFELVKSPEVTLCGWWGYKPSINNNNCSACDVALCNTFVCSSSTSVCSACDVFALCSTVFSKVDKRSPHLTCLCALQALQSHSACDVFALCSTFCPRVDKRSPRTRTTALMPTLRLWTTSCSVSCSPSRCQKVHCQVKVFC